MDVAVIESMDASNKGCKFPQYVAYWIRADPYRVPKCRQRAGGAPTGSWLERPVSGIQLRIRPLGAESDDHGLGSPQCETNIKRDALANAAGNRSQGSRSERV